MMVGMMEGEIFCVCTCSWVPMLYISEDMLIGFYNFPYMKLWAPKHLLLWWACTCTYTCGWIIVLIPHCCLMIEWLFFYFLFSTPFHYNRWTTASIYLFQNSVRLFLHITRAGQQGMQFLLCLIFLSCWSILDSVRFCSELLDPSFLFALDNGEKYSIQPMRFTALLKMTRVKVK